MVSCKFLCAYLNSTPLSVLKQKTSNNILSFFYLISHARRRYSKEIPATFLLPEKNKPQGNEDAQIINKLLSMVGQSKSTIDKKMESIDSVHESYKYNTLYKIGYTVSYLNKTHDGLEEMYRLIMDKNRNAWNVLKILSSYEQMLKANEFLSKMLKILNNMVVRQNKLNHAKNDTKIDKQDLSFAWSYYDDENSAN